MGCTVCRIKLEQIEALRQRVAELEADRDRALRERDWHVSEAIRLTNKLAAVEQGAAMVQMSGGEA